MAPAASGGPRLARRSSDLRVREGWRTKRTGSGPWCGHHSPGGWPEPDRRRAGNRGRWPGRARWQTRRRAPPVPTGRRVHQHPVRRQPGRRRPAGRRPDHPSGWPGSPGGPTSPRRPSSCRRGRPAPTTASGLRGACVLTGPVGDRGGSGDRPPRSPSGCWQRTGHQALRRQPGNRPRTRREGERLLRRRHDLGRCRHPDLHRRGGGPVRAGRIAPALAARPRRAMRG